ncbi:MAG: hypothetical protein ACLFV0_04680 [Nitriliruptoraceae bacterium]
MVRPSDPAVARAFAALDPGALPTLDGGIVNGEDPEAISDTCRAVTVALCARLDALGIDACEVYLFVDHARRQVDVSRACEVWRREAAAGRRWGHVVLGVPGRRGANPHQLAGPRGPVELWDFTGRQYDAAIAIPHLIDLGTWGPYERPQRPVCRLTGHRQDRRGLARCLLPDPTWRRYLTLP